MLVHFKRIEILEKTKQKNKIIDKQSEKAWDAVNNNAC